MCSENKFNSLVYPIHKHIRLEIDHANSSWSSVSSDCVKVGKGKWSLCASKWERDMTLGVNLFVYGANRLIKFHVTYRIINQKVLGQDKIEEKECKSTGFLIKRAMFIEWPELVSGGYVKDDKIIIECCFWIDSEVGVKRRNINFKEDRPNLQDLKAILEKKEFSLEVEEFDEEIEVSRISETRSSSDEIFVFGFPAKLEFAKHNNSMRVYLTLNDDNECEWWVWQVTCKVWIVHRDENSSICKPFEWYYWKENPCGHTSFEWDKLMDAGFVKDGKLKIKVLIQMNESFGLEEPKRVQNQSIRGITDVELVVNQQHFKVAKKVLAQQSSYFKDLFESNPEKYEFEIENVDTYNFIRFLELVHNFDTDICEIEPEPETPLETAGRFMRILERNHAIPETCDVQGLLEIIDRFKAAECFERCDGILKKQDFKDTMNVLEWVDKYPLPGLRRSVLVKLKNEALLHTVVHSDRFKNLSAPLRLAIIEWKVVPEKSRTEQVEPEEYLFRTDFQTQTSMTDIEIKVNGHSYYASKQILSSASYFFMKQFYGPYSEGGTEISVFHVSLLNFERLLTHIYHPTRPVTSNNIDSLLQLSYQFSVPKLMDKCEEYLVLNDSVSLIDKLKYCGRFDLPYLMAACLNEAEDPIKMESIKKEHKMLSSHVLGELMRREIEMTVARQNQSTECSRKL